MRLSISLTTLLGCTVVSLASSPQPARADTYSFAAMMEEDNAGEGNCLGWGDSAEGAVGVFPESPNNGCPATQRAVMPLYWRNFYFPWTVRTVSVRGKLNFSGDQISCTLYAIGPDGFVYSQDTESFTTLGSYSVVNLNIVNVFSTSTSIVACSMSGSTHLLNVSYNP